MHKLECIIKHSHLAIGSMYELLHDLNDEYIHTDDEEKKRKITEIQLELLDILNVMEDINLEIITMYECRVNPARLSKILENLTHMEYHADERAKATDNKDEKIKLIELGRRIRAVRKTLLIKMFK